jgi:hypothetical protein
MEVSMENKDRMLSFAEFVKEKNSFRLHFVGKVGKHVLGDIYRGQAAYKACLEAHPGFAKLAAELREMNPKSPDYLAKLYAAYKLMHPYTERDWDMFI